MVTINNYEDLVAAYPELALFDKHTAIYLAYLTGEVDGRRNLLDRLAVSRELKGNEGANK